MTKEQSTKYAADCRKAADEYAASGEHAIASSLCEIANRIDAINAADAAKARGV